MTKHITITGIIQRNKEDIALNSFKNIVAAANLYQASYGQDTVKAIGNSTKPITAKDLLTEGYITDIPYLTNDDENELNYIIFYIENNGNRLVTSIKGEVFTVGRKWNTPMPGLSESEVANMTIKKLFSY